MSVHYVENNELEIELHKSAVKDRLTDKAGIMFQLMAVKLSGPLPYPTEEMRKDVQAFAVGVCVRYWRKWEPEKGKAFSYFTSVVNNGLKAGWNKYHSKGIHISFDALFDSENTE